MPARVMVIGLDAAESTLLKQWASEGYLQSFAHLSAAGCVCRLDNSLETLPGAIWPELVGGRSCGKSPRYYHRRQLHTGEARMRPITPEEAARDPYYWMLASQAGCRVAVIDQPQTVLVPHMNGLQLIEWGLHDRNFDIASEPPELLDEIRARYGDHPVQACDLHGEKREGYERLLGNLLAGVRRKTALSLDLLGRERWDLFSCTYGETHCAGHQFWHFFDPLHPAYDPAAPPHLREAIRSVYRQIDEGVGALIDAAGPDATVLVVASHGMGPAIGGPQLLPEVLVRLGMGSTPHAAATYQIRRLQTVVSHAPRRLQSFLRRLANTRAVGRFQASAGCLLDPLESYQTRAAALRNNRCGAIRLNLKGREPFGRVEPGPEAASLIAELRSELLALGHPATGEPIVKKVVTATEAFGSGHHPDVPDLLVTFRTDLGPLEACWSHRVGHVRVANYHPNIPRTGDHTVESCLWLKGPGLPVGIELVASNVLDLAPTVLRLLDVPLPDTLDGRPLAVVEAQVQGPAWTQQ